MRRLGRLLLLSLLLLGLIALWYSGWQPGVSLPLRGGQSEDPRLAGARLHLTYTLHREDWLSVPLLGSDAPVRVLSNATLAGTPANFADARWRYALEYQLLDRSGDLIEARPYHHISRVVRYRDADSGEVRTALFYLEPRQILLSTRTLAIRPPAGAVAATLRLRLADSDPELPEVVARVYQQEQLPERELGVRWQRLNRTQQTEIARASLYGPELLQPQEIRNLMRRRWVPLGPSGIEGSDYQLRRLYVLDDPEDTPIDPEPIQPAGLVLDWGLAATVPLPEESSLVLRAYPLEPDSAPPANPLQLFWYGRGTRERLLAQLLPVPAWETPLPLPPMAGGLLELRSAEPLSVRLFRRGPEGEQELIPEPDLLRLYQPGPGTTLEYAVTPAGDTPVPLRIDLRVQRPSYAGQTVRYQLLDADGAVLGRGELVATVQPSRYDRLQRPPPQTRVSAPTRYHFALDPAVRTVRLEAPAPVLLAAYTRPPALSWLRLVPEDYQYRDGDTGGHPAWFPLRPRSALELIRADRAPLLALYPRPPETDPDVLAGRYRLENYYPEGDWRGRDLLNPRDPQAPLPDRARYAVFRTLAANRPQTLELRGQPGRRRIEPSLLYARDTEDPFRVQVRIDGQVVHAAQLSGRRGEVRLPPIPVGSHQLELDSTEPARWLINYAGAEPPAFSQRLAYRMAPEGLSFVHEKTTPTEEVLTGRWQVPADTTERSRLQVRIEARREADRVPSTSWTLLARDFDIAPDPAEQVIVLGTRDQFVDAGRLFFLPLGDDLPPGRYRIRIRQTAGPPGYLSLYRLEPGTFSLRSFFTEEGHDEATVD
ncbi:MAG: hypothetical protein R3202_07725 [Candidatus Competibacterales bacterium]|nr:hypothetical protein [Candidatus Competibacterales bacterium]